MGQLLAPGLWTVLGFSTGEGPSRSLSRHSRRDKKQVNDSYAARHHRTPFLVVIGIGSMSSNTPIMDFQTPVSEGVLLRFLWRPISSSFLALDKTTVILAIVGAFLLFPSIIQYCLDVSKWHSANRLEKPRGNEGRLPPKYPSIIPYLGNALSFAWNNDNFLSRATYK